MNKLILLLLPISIIFAQTLDTDNDLVPNKLDKCLNTPEGVFVNKYGCTKEIKKIVYFGRGLYNINDKEQDVIDDIILLAKEGFGYNILIEGHTDSTADAQYNMKLSERRSNTIEKILLVSGVNKKRIDSKWYGETMPIASNITEISRAKNRRVTITFK